MFTIAPTSFGVIPSRQNPYLDPDVDWELAQRQHANLRRALGNPPAFAVPRDAPVDLVFAANSCLNLPRLPHPTYVLSLMKYAQRRKEAAYVAKMLPGRIIPFPGPDPFEGEGEGKWFHQGRLLVVGYGFRCTRRSVRVLDELLRAVYTTQGVTPPKVVALKLVSPFFYHLDLAMLAVSEHEALVNPAAIRDLSPLEGHLDVKLFPSSDPFALNAVVQGKRLVAHKLDARTRRQLERASGKQIVEVDVSEFEKAGGGVKCMVAT